MNVIFCKRMDIDRIRYFLTIADSGSMTAAARILRISPPALSKAMSVLESELGAKLWRKEGRNLFLTDQGKSLLAPARDLLQRAEGLQNLARGNNAMQRDVVRIGTFEVFSTYVFGEFMSELDEATDCVLYELIPGEIEQALIDHQIDFGITYIPIPKRGLVFEKIGQVKMNLFCGVSSAKKFAKVPTNELPFAAPLSLVEGSPNRVRGLDGWPDDTEPRLTPFKITLLETALELCRKGAAVAFIPEFIARLHNERSNDEHKVVVMDRRLPQVGKQDVFLVRRESDDESRVMRKCASVVRKVTRIQ
jgi:DNA-binding transcriptional LysR family regulator